MATNLSDCASMGASAESALIQLVFPKNDPDLKKIIEEKLTESNRTKINL
jgi:thiamine monophosphate kinase